MTTFISTLINGSSLLLAFLLLVRSRKVNTIGNRWFVAFVFSIFFLTLEDSLTVSSIGLNHDFISILLVWPIFLIAPVFYISVSYFINPNRQWKHKDYLHFVTGLGLVFYIIVVYGLFYKSELYESTAIIVLSTLINFVPILQILAYVAFSYREISKHQHNIVQYVSSVEKIDLKWLEYVTKGVFVIVLFWAIEIFFPLPEFVKGTFSLIYLGGIFFIAYYSITQIEVFPFNKTKQAEMLEIVNENTGTKKKLLTDQTLEEYKVSLNNLMSTAKPYLDSELSLSKLAIQSNVTPHLLSYVINNGYNENFYQFINRHRVEEAKKVLLDAK